MQFKNNYDKSEHGGTSDQYDELSKLEDEIKNSEIMNEKFADTN